MEFAMDMETQFIEVNGIKLHVKLAGPTDGEPVLLLHGFPEFWYGWRGQIPALVEKGFRVVVPDQRGYNLSDKPAHIEDYRISLLATDAAGLMSALGYEQFHLVGHDWGAAVSWWVARMFPEKLRTLTILNVPYPPLMVKAYRNFNLGQMFKSWYIAFFQIPELPERLLATNNYAPFADAIRRSGHPETFSEEDIAAYREAWGQPGALKAMLNWYRAMLRNNMSSGNNKSSEVRDPQPFKMPVLILWGEQDIALSKELAQQSIDLCANGRLVFFTGATHWVQHDETEQVNRLLIEHISAHQS